MANNLISNPIRVDTAFSTSYKAGGGNPTSGPLYIDEIYWYNPTATNTFVVNNADGTALRDGICVTTAQSVSYQQYGRMVTDFSVPTLVGGVLFIYYH